MAGIYAQDIAGFGQRDLLDVITSVDGKTTPCLTTFAKKSANMGEDALLKEWPVDNEENPISSAVPSYAVPEGSDVSTFDNTNANYAVLSNRVQWVRTAAQVGKLANITQNQAGVKNKKARAIQKKLKQLARTMETIICGDGDSQVGTALIGNKMKQMGSFLSTTQSGATAVPSAYTPPAAQVLTSTLALFAETTLQGVITSQFQATGQNRTRMLVCGTALKQKFVEFTRTATSSTNVMSAVRVFNQDSSAKKIVSVVDVFVGEFGTIELLPTLWNNYNYTTNVGDANRGYIIDQDRWFLDFKQQAAVQPLPDLGGGERFLADVVFTLGCLNPLDQAALKLT
jgi:hypothetical protein